MLLILHCQNSCHCPSVSLCGVLLLAWTLWTALFLCGDLWPCLYLCEFLHTTLKQFTFPHLLHVLQYVWYCFCWSIVPEYLQFSLNFISLYTLPTVYSDLVSVYFSSSQSLLHLIHCLTLHSVPLCFYPLGPN